MAKVKRVLHCGMTNGIGGVETFLINLYRYIDRNKLQFDFITTHDGNIAFCDEINNMGGRIYPILYRKSESFIKHHLAWTKFFEEHHEEYVAVHMNSNFPRYIAPLAYAKKVGIEKRIFHAHNSNDMYPSTSFIVNTKKKLTEIQTFYGIGQYATHCFACSKEAGNYMFRNRYQFQVIPNGIDASKFTFNKDIRKKKRAELGLKDKLVIGMVGRLQYQKNPEFAMDLFGELCKKISNARLVFVGKGNLEEALYHKAKIFNMEDKVIFLGARTDVNELMQAFDCLLMPSNFEGFGITAIEAQAAGLPVICSDAVPMETKLTNYIRYISLHESKEIWIKTILECRSQERKSTYNEIAKAGFDIKEVAKRMQAFYLGEVL